MSGLFIPPSGAMQFEIAGFSDKPVWVGQLCEIGTGYDDRPDGCCCRGGYPLINANGLLIEVVGGGNYEPALCECWGRIIE